MPDRPPDKVRLHPHHAMRNGQRAEGESAPRARRSKTPYAELAVTTNFTFLTGASHPDEMVERAAELGHAAAAIADTNTLAGIVRAHVAAKEVGIPLAVGGRVVLGKRRSDGATERRSKEGVEVSGCRGVEGGQEEKGHRDKGIKGQSEEKARRSDSASDSLSLCPSVPLSLLLFPTSRPAYSRLCRLLTLGKRRAPKGECHLTLEDVVEHIEGMLAVILPQRGDEEEIERAARALREVLGRDDLFLGARRAMAGDDGERLRAIADLSRRISVPLVGVNEALYHDPSRRALQDVLTCVRTGCTIEEAGLRLEASAERHLKPPREMACLLRDIPGAVERSAEVALRAAAFSLDELKYEYPAEECPPGLIPAQHLAKLTWAGAQRRYPEGVPDAVRRQIEHELALIEELRYESYFLTCEEISTFAKSKGILCQGRGAAANSAVCYCLGVTAVDPSKIQLLFERFVSRARNEPPDIDIDFEHERREEVIQHIYERYGRDRAALTAEVISYRGRSAVRDVGKAMGLAQDAVDAMARSLDWWRDVPDDERAREAGLNAGDSTVRRVLQLSRELCGFPRHLSQHVGGFVITRSPLCELVPIENAAMEDRTVIEWDKDDIDAMGMLKVDVLGLGMLTCLNKGLAFVERCQGVEVSRCRGGAEGVSCVGNQDKGEAEYGNDQVVSGSACVAERQGVEQGDLPGDRAHAEIGDVRADLADATIGCVDSFEHRRGLQPQDPTGVHPWSACCQRVTSGTQYAMGDRHGTGHDQVECDDRESPRRDRPHALCADPQARRRPLALRACEDCSSFLPRHLDTSTPRHLPPVPLSLSSFSLTDPRVYAMLCRADSVGVFQVESRAQMSMLPRLKPREFYDLVIEVAIVRPGPIQGKMVHPYLRRRAGREPVEFPNEDLRRVLGRTLGVPLFQEQAMQLAIVAAGFTPDEADQLRRAMAAWKRKGKQIVRFGERLVRGMIERGYPEEFAQRCFQQIQGFSEYGFPESHAASFALLVYASAWLKRFHPAAFAAALINSQPMGFYQPAQIVRDAREHGVEVRGVDVNCSGWDCSLEERDKGIKGQRDRGERENGKWKVESGNGDAGPSDSSGIANPSTLSLYPFIPLSLRSDAPPESWGADGPALRLGMRLVKGLREDEARRIEETVRHRGPLRSIDTLRRASGVKAASLRALARADAFNSMGLDRRAALWHIRAMRDETLPLFEESDGAGAGAAAQERRESEAAAALPRIPERERVLMDYQWSGLSLKAHPVSFIRQRLGERRVIPASDLRSARLCPQGRAVSIAGVVLVRQRPGTASGVVFITLEDETGVANLIIWSKTFERFRRAARLSAVLLAHGKVEREGEVVHIVVSRLESLDEWIGSMEAVSRDFH